MGDHFETFLFGLMTGIAAVATVNYFVLLSRSRFNDGRFPQHHSAASPHSRQSLLSGSHSRQASSDNEPDLAREIVASLDSQLILSSSKLQRIVLHMVSEFKKGLNSDNEMIKMLPSYVVKRPSGNEIGTFLALDLGGTNFRVCRVALEGYGKIRMGHAKYTVSDTLKTGPQENLFDFFAESVYAYCKENGIDVTNPSAPIPLGFTFSFPVNQTALDAGSLVKWTKGFACPGVEGEEVVGLLKAALKRKGLCISVKAIVNDTVGTLIAHAYEDPQTLIGVILGTGTNAAYVEQIQNVKKWDTEMKGEVVVNTEWGNYNEPSILPTTKWDQKIDRQSLNPKKQIFEKMISGMYLGEICRVIIHDLVQSGELFGGKGSTKLKTKDAFETAYMARAERDHSLSLSDIKQLLEDVMEVPKTTYEDRRVIKHICELVGTRAARLSAAGVAALVTKINRLDGCTVAIDGSVFEHYPHFGNRMRDALHELLGIMAQNIVLEQARDGSGQGAALIAALAD